MSTKSIYEPRYGASHALVIGINEYQHAPRLGYARNDAEVFARVLIDRFAFPADNVKVLLDGSATRAEVFQTFMRYAQDVAVGEDDRIVVFFAGHGHTVPGRRGETGFLVPVDGHPGDLSTLIRWDDLTRNADLIVAKHMLFVMDACYGGLALTRSPLSIGSMRFVRDMLQRFSRQVLTAGKADETVADANGPRPGHSIFTGHLLDALEGAALSEGVMTAGSVMSYVYQKVAADHYSRQTPHFGFLDGDGDFIFTAEGLDGKDGKKVIDVPVKVIGLGDPNPAPVGSVAETVKDLLSTPNHQIRLDDFVATHVRSALEATSVEKFPVQAVNPDKDEFVSRIARYEDAVSDLTTMAVLMGRWSTEGQLPLLEKMLGRFAEGDKGTTGSSLCIRLSSYPTLYLMYAAGVASLAAGNYPALARVLTTPVHPQPHAGRDLEPITLAVIRELTDIADAFKWLPGHERHWVPRSEHIRTRQQPVLEDLLFLGRAYDRHFDQFEILLSLTYVDLTDRSWGPPGRFAWRHSERGGSGGPYIEMMKDAERLGDDWPPVKAGLFGGSSKRFLEVAGRYKQALLDGLGWY